VKFVVPLVGNKKTYLHTSIVRKMINNRIVNAQQAEAIDHSLNISYSAVTEKFAVWVLADFCIK